MSKDKGNGQAIVENRNYLAYQFRPLGTMGRARICHSAAQRRRAGPLCRDNCLEGSDTALISQYPN